MEKAVKSGDLKAFSDYFKAVQATLAGGHASEGSHYPALKALLECLSKDITATSLPSRIECGAPDFMVMKHSSPIGYIEAKDIGKSLNEAEKSEQLQRYRKSLSNLVLTDFLEFRWYIDSDRKLSACLGLITKDGKIKRDETGIQAVVKLRI